MSRSVDTYSLPPRERVAQRALAGAGTMQALARTMQSVWARSVRNLVSWGWVGDRGRSGYYLGTSHDNKRLTILRVPIACAPGPAVRFVVNVYGNDGGVAGNKVLFFFGGPNGAADSDATAITMNPTSDGWVQATDAPFISGYNAWSEAVGELVVVVPESSDAAHNIDAISVWYEDGSNDELSLSGFSGPATSWTAQMTKPGGASGLGNDEQPVDTHSLKWLAQHAGLLVSQRRQHVVNQWLGVTFSTTNDPTRTVVGRYRIHAGPGEASASATLRVSIYARCSAGGTKTCVVSVDSTDRATFITTNNDHIGAWMTSGGVEYADIIVAAGTGTKEVVFEAYDDNTSGNNEIWVLGIRAQFIEAATADYVATGDDAPAKFLPMDVSRPEPRGAIVDRHEGAGTTNDYGVGFSAGTVTLPSYRVDRYHLARNLMATYGHKTGVVIGDWRFHKSAGVKINGGSSETSSSGGIFTLIRGRNGTAAETLDGYLPGFNATAADDTAGSLLAVHKLFTSRGTAFVVVRAELETIADGVTYTRNIGHTVASVRFTWTGTNAPAAVTRTLTPGLTYVEEVVRLQETIDYELRVDGMCDANTSGDGSLSWALCLNSLSVIEKLTDERMLDSYMETSEVVYAGGAVSIPDNDTVTGASINLVVAEEFYVDHVRVRVVVTHTARETLIVKLKHPDGTLVTLINSDLSAGANVDLWISDDVSGDTAPTAALSALRNKEARGTWILRVYDDTAGTTGTIDNNCELQLT